MQKEIKINLEVWHTEIENDTLIIYGCRPNGKRDTTTKIHIDLKNKEWFAQQLPKQLITYIRGRIGKLTDIITNIKSS